MAPVIAATALVIVIPPSVALLVATVTSLAMAAAFPL
jgi:hypothetical protein